MELTMFIGIILTIYCFQLVNGQMTTETVSGTVTSTNVREGSTIATDTITNEPSTYSTELVTLGINTELESISVGASQTEETTADNADSIVTTLATTSSNLRSNAQTQEYNSEGTTIKVESTVETNSVSAAESDISPTKENNLASETTSTEDGTTVAVETNSLSTAESDISQTKANSSIISTLTTSQELVTKTEIQHIITEIKFTTESDIRQTKANTLAPETSSTESSIISTLMTSHELLVTENEIQTHTMTENTSTGNTVLSTASFLTPTGVENVTKQNNEDDSEETTFIDELKSTRNPTAETSSSLKTTSNASTERITMIIDITPTSESSTATTPTPDFSVGSSTENHQKETTMITGEDSVDSTMVPSSILTSISKAATFDDTTLVASKSSIPTEENYASKHEGDVTTIHLSTWEHTSMPFQESTIENINVMPSDAASEIADVSTQVSMYTKQTDEIGASSQSPTTQEIIRTDYTFKPTEQSLYTSVNSIHLSSTKSDGDQTVFTTISQHKRLSTYQTTQEPCSKSCTNGWCKWKDEVPICVCNDGYILDSKQDDVCEDVNECTSTACTGDGDLCKNLPGSYECNCRAGWEQQNSNCIRADSWKGSFRATMWNNEVLSYTLVEDPKSDSYTKIYEMFNKLLTTTYESNTDFIRVEIVGFSNGSIIVNYNLIFRADGKLTEETLKTTLEDGLSSQPDLNVDIDSIQCSDFEECSSVDKNDCSENSICIEMAGSFTCKCLGGYEDTSRPEYGPGRECTVACNCENGGNCTHRGTPESVTCSCLDGYSGDRCEIKESFLNWITDNAIIIYFCAAIFLIILLFCCCYICRRRSKNRKPSVVLTGQTLLSDPSQDERHDPFHRWHPYLQGEKDNPIYKESPPETLTKAPSIESDNDARMQHLVQIMQEDKFKNLLQGKLRVQPRLVNSDGNSSLRSTSWLYEDGGDLPEFSSSSSPTFIRPYVASGNEALELVSVNQAESTRPQ